METAGAEARDKGSVPYIKESRKIFRQELKGVSVTAEQTKTLKRVVDVYESGLYEAIYNKALNEDVIESASFGTYKRIKKTTTR
ncbi:MAG: hypothetical protein A2905_04340 [Candidatus Levybacteria bacterium RIFCSPLOWO2_01_FULL_36_10]|nr:MAG: hypothetical protein A2905_04340 [Candidatus Levybacteria bacterium RIFCSPLOWO2_01_FULL_36_10]